MAINPDDVQIAPGQDSAESELISFIIYIGTGMWRVREKLIPAGTSQPPDELLYLYRPFESTWSKLIQSGVEILSHNGDIILGGEALRIIAFKPVAGLSRDTVMETIRPTIYYKGKLIQMGEVIVGTPIGSEQPKESRV